MARRPHDRTASLLVLLLASAMVAVGCQGLGRMLAQPEIRCGRFSGPDCNDLVELAADAVARGKRTDEPSVVAVSGACPDNARCLPSALGGEEVAVAFRWFDGSTAWVTIPLPADWPDSAAGEATLQDGQVPEHLQPLVAGPIHS
jgi:hypothetical protein